MMFAVRKQSMNVEPQLMNQQWGINHSGLCKTNQPLNQFQMSAHQPRTNTDLNFPNNYGRRSNWKDNQSRKKKRVGKKKLNRTGTYAHAPRNTTSYLIRSKKEGGIAAVTHPSPVTPAVLATPAFSPSREALVDKAKEEWGLDGYGSMEGLLKLLPGDGGAGSVASRFEMVYPKFGMGCRNVLGDRVDDQESQLFQLEEEKLLLKERVYLMEKELGKMKKRMQCLDG